MAPGATDATDATNETADPQQQVSLRSSMDLPRNITLDAALRWVDKLHINNGPTGGPVVGIVPSYFELDSRLAWHAERASSSCPSSARICCTNNTSSTAFRRRRASRSCAACSRS